MKSAVVTDRDSYGDSDEALITVTAVEGSGPVEGVAIRMVVTSPVGHDLEGAVTTGADGEASLRLAVDALRDGTGTYAVGATTSKEGFEPSESAALFEVREATP